MSAEFRVNDTSKSYRDCFVIEYLADTLCAGEGVEISERYPEAVVQELYEGPRKCQCCINWMTERPHDVDLTEVEKKTMGMKPAILWSSDVQSVQAKTKRFEKAIVEEQDKTVNKILVTMR
ncbi:hypothetical protein CDEST_09839 [Colletotrichum destructivum]|uniref:Uncharacterized protein n=1 Tax=Colletotrichum destructivum TaxID=34406 RepID=A0AAX4IPD2_9PEZI|nr:hypothetical protein CDEST_09839 [Colletotrichum destructivum]